jgi:hypothetical protein
MNTDWNDLIQRYIAEQTTEEETRRLEAALKADDALADLYLRHVELDVALEAHAGSQAAFTELLVSPHQTESRRWKGRLSWRPLTAAAAGIALGIFCTSMVFAYVAPSLGKVITLLQDSFDSGPAPEVIGVPTKPGIWSGDFTEIVGEEQGVKPETGKKMLRFLSADYEGKPNPGGYSADLFGLIDVRPFRREFSDGGAVVQLSAAFNAIALPADEKYECDVCIFALDADMATDGSMRLQNRLFTGSLAMARSSRNVLDRDPATWQRMACELRLPPNTDFLMIRIGVVHASHMPGAFAGHYADDVRVTMARRERLP